MVKKFCFYLPQFHTIAENDQWWGKGFTEWTNVRKTTPRFNGHRQPQIPTDLGFYDLKQPQVQEKQAELASQYGIDGFIYYHYWFHGKRMLHEPIDNVLQSGKPEFPFAFCWANETWTRAWDGLDKEILIEQTYSNSDHIEHIQFLLNCFKDERYIKIEGKPLFLIYRPNHMESLNFFVATLNIEAKKHGFPGIYLCGVKSSFKSESELSETQHLYDGIIDFQPNAEDFPKPDDLFTKLVTALKVILPDSIYQTLKLKGKGNKRVNYKKLVEYKKQQSLDMHKKVFPCIFPSWDNSPRRDTATIIQNDDANLFKDWYQHAKKHAETYDEQEQLVFINAWNEWAEGCHLEPDTEMGHKFLQAINDE
ncbi:MAG: glycoside hydrolase family 99-like domain-containing protein [Pseudomonadales bacterium]|nr:glycoside hydrolase family 99-like domain-containing protein [Pseudomonadales bacterium]